MGEIVINMTKYYRAEFTQKYIVLMCKSNRW